MNAFKALKIDTASRKIEEIELTSWEQIAPAIGNGCTIITAPVEFDNLDTIYADDEGLYHSFEGGFMMNDWHYPLVGNALLIGTDENGDNADVKTTKEELENMITWVDKEQAQAWANKFL